MDKIHPDRTAQHLWRGVATASDAISNLVTEIPCATVSGEESRRELREAQALLGQAAALLARTSERETARYTEAEVRS
jgi:hypothetical protein